MLIQRALTGTIVNNNWWFALEQAIKFESIRYSINLVTRGNKKEKDLVRGLEGAMRTGSASQLKVKKIELNQHLETKQIVCIVSRL